MEIGREREAEKTRKEKGDRIGAAKNTPRPGFGGAMFMWDTKRRERGSAKAWPYIFKSLGIHAFVE